ncbi:MAG: rhodanese-like domain-containing protein [Bacteroidota bacterium]
MKTIPIKRWMKRFVGQIRKDVFRVGIVLLVGLFLGLGWNYFHPMKLPVIPEKVKIPGIPLHIWKHFDQLSPKEAYKRYKESGKNKTFLVDTRDHGSYIKKRAKGALFLPYVSFEKHFNTFKDKVEKDDSLLIYCYGTGCALSPRIGKRLVVRGYKNVAIIQGGFNAWKKAYLPVEKSKETADQ